MVAERVKIVAGQVELLAAWTRLVLMDGNGGWIGGTGAEW
jgi:hypothetical protein